MRSGIYWSSLFHLINRHANIPFGLLLKRKSGARWSIILPIQYFSIFPCTPHHECICCTKHYLNQCSRYHVIWRVLCQKQGSRAGTSNYIPQFLWDVITCPCPWYLLLAQHSCYVDINVVYPTLYTQIVRLLCFKMIQLTFLRWGEPII